MHEQITKYLCEIASDCEYFPYAYYHKIAAVLVDDYAITVADE